MIPFTHLHVHSQYSILDGASNIPALIKKAKCDGMTALAITDHGNMFGVKEFFNEVNKANKPTKEAIKAAEKKGEPVDELKKQLFKPIIGCEVYVANTSRLEKKGKENLSGNHLILLAKNKVGYHNLIKLVSLGWTEGFYSKPRIDKELLLKYHEGLIASSACIAGEIPRSILRNNYERAEKALLEYKELFGEDFYLEIQRHETYEPLADQEIFPKQQEANKALIELSKKFDVKLIATNDVHFINQEDAEAHDILICLNTGADFDDIKRMRYSKQEWLKTQKEMNKIFADIPEALENTNEIIAKIEIYDIDSAPIMPDFPLPEGFTEPNDYLQHLTYEGAKKRYVEITDEIKERIDFELSVIKNMGFPGYFLIVQDFLNAAREMGVWVGPGRGSAAGSVVAYSLKITDIDPLKYDLLFERFLNPDRISMPDIDIDFDDDGRELVLKWVTNKYGKEKVAHIITFGSMAAKSAIRDVARVKKLPLSQADRLAKLIPDGVKVTLSQAFKEVKELKDAQTSDDKLVIETLKYAVTLEGSVRNTGIHACGVIIGKDDLTNYIPLSTTKDNDSDVLVTQYEGKYVEDVGMLKMDFLGLKTLSIMKDAVENIKISKGIDIDISTIPLDDAATYELYSCGETTGTFQFESDGMKKYLKDLKPNKFEDLIAMNALYRPGPMDYIPSFINRKHGREKIEYDFPVMETRLKDTYGITVYQEQVMLLSRDMAGFSRGDSDKLRKAMGKKQIEVMNNLKVKFIEGCKSNNLEEEKAIKVWADWEKFAEYAFNKSHSTCYSYVAYQTAYLKAHYPAEYMAAVLSRNITDIKKISIFMDECKRMGLAVLSPDVNESHLKFTVNKSGAIRFGLGAIKGVGESAVQSIVEERTKNGDFKDIFDFVERGGSSAVNKRTIEALVIAGAFDAFSFTRSQYLQTDATGSSVIETLLKYGGKVKGESNAAPSLFGETHSVEASKPDIPKCEELPKVKQLGMEKEYIGIYLSAHPLDEFKIEIKSFCNTTLSQFQNIKDLNNKDIAIAGIVTEVKKAIGKNGKPWGSITIEDYTDSYRHTFFGSDFVNFSNYFVEGYSLIIKGKVQKNEYRKDKEEPELKIASIDLLSNTKETMIKSLSLKFQVQELTPDVIKQIQILAEQNKGKTILKFLIYDNSSKVWVEMFSRTHKVNLTSEFVNFLELHKEIDYKIN